MQLIHPPFGIGYVPLSLTKEQALATTEIKFEFHSNESKTPAYNKITFAVSRASTAPIRILTLYNGQFLENSVVSTVLPIKPYFGNNSEYPSLVDTWTSINEDSDNDLGFLQYSDLNGGYYLKGNGPINFSYYVNIYVR